MGGRHGQRHRVVAGPQGSREGSGVHPSCRAGGGVRESESLPRRFGDYGGRYVPETLIPALDDLERDWLAARDDPGFEHDLERLLRDYARRRPRLSRAERLSEECGRRVSLKREDLMHTGSQKINNALGQTLLAKRMGKP